MDYLQRDRYFINRISYRIDLEKKNDNLWNARCPICGDSKKNSRKKRFFIYIKDRRVQTTCHNCDWYGSLFKFIKQQFPELVEEYKFWGFSPKKVSLAESTLKAIDTLPEKEYPTYVYKNDLHDLTKGFNELISNHPARLYIEKRQIPFQFVRYCNNFFKLSEELYQDDTFRSYAIPCTLIPFYRSDDKIEIIQARFFDPKVKPKYITVKLNPEALKIYNQDYVDPSKDVYVLEGPIDSLFVDNAIALGGASGVPPFEKVIWCFDNDKDNQEMDAKILQKIKQKEKVIVWKGTDNFKDINQGIMRGLINKHAVNRFLEERTFEGLKAQLEFSKLKKTR
jgi:hypothetical protein